MGSSDREPTPDTYRGDAGGSDGSGATRIWRGRHGLVRNDTRHCLWALAGDDQKTDGAAGACGVS